MKTSIAIAMMALTISGASAADRNYQAEAELVMTATAFDKFCTTPLPKAIRAIADLRNDDPKVDPYKEAAALKVGTMISKAGVGLWCRIANQALMKQFAE